MQLVYNLPVYDVIRREAGVVVDWRLDPECPDFTYKVAVQYDPRLPPIVTQSHLLRPLTSRDVH